MTNPKGSFIWYELMTGDPEGATAFYQTVVGWKISGKADSPNPGIDYRHIARDDGGSAGGMLALTGEMIAGGAHPCWAGYLYVADVDAEAAAIAGAAIGALKPCLTTSCSSIMCWPTAAAMPAAGVGSGDKHLATGRREAGHQHVGRGVGGRGVGAATWCTASCATLPAIVAPPNDHVLAADRFPALSTATTVNVRHPSPGLIDAVPIGLMVVPSPFCRSQPPSRFSSAPRLS